MKRFFLSGLAVLGLGCISTSAFAQYQLNYNFTVASGFTLNDVVLIAFLPGDHLTYNYTVNGTFTGGQNVTGSVTVNSLNLNADLNLFAQFTDPNGVTDVAMAVPTALHDSLIQNNTPWDQVGNSTNYFDTAANFGGQQLSSEANTLVDIQTDQGYGIASLMAYDDPSAPVLLAQGASSGIVAFDGAEDAGKFSFQAAPEPAQFLLPLVGVLGVLMRKRTS